LTLYSFVFIYLFQFVCVIAGPVQLKGPTVIPIIKAL
jgi:hypothetical protein